MLFSERQKTLRDEWPTILRNNIFSHTTREQCWQHFKNSYSSLDTYSENHVSKFLPDCEKIVKCLREKKGKPLLTERSKIYYDNGFHDKYEKELYDFFINGFEGDEAQSNIEHAFDVLELICLLSHKRPQIVGAINNYLRLGETGYKFLNNQLTPYQDENFLETAIIPTLSLLNQGRYKSSYKYMQDAYDKYRTGNYQSAIDECNKSYECLLKEIFNERGIQYDKKKDTLNPLIQKAQENNLFFSNSQSISSVVNLLKSSSDIRNKFGGHGDSKKNPGPKEVMLAIHHATANMLYILEKHMELSQT